MNMKDFVLNFAKELYGVTDKEIELAFLIEENIDTEAGYNYYFELTKSVKDNNLPDDILYDAASSFMWNDKLDEEFKKIAIKNGREDLI